MSSKHIHQKSRDPVHNKFSSCTFLRSQKCHSSQQIELDATAVEDSCTCCISESWLVAVWRRFVWTFFSAISLICPDIKIGNHMSHENESPEQDCTVTEAGYLWNGGSCFVFLWHCPHSELSRLTNTSNHPEVLPGYRWPNLFAWHNTVPAEIN